MPLTVTLWSIVALLGVGALGIALASNVAASRVVFGLCFGLSVILFVAAVVPRSAVALTASFPLGLPWIGAHFRLDVLSAFFLAIVNLGGAAASLYAIGYGAHEKHPSRILPFFPVFLAGMNLVILADDAFSFLVAWEFMSLSSWALVMAHHHDAENRRAGFVYLLMASFGTLALLMAFGLLAGSVGGYSFADIREAAHGPSWKSGLVLALVLLGAGSKAGLVPLHIWLPLAHPAAPSHVSALMSGVMTKVAIYGFIRIVFDLLGPPEFWWSMPPLTLGAITAMLGILSATIQSDLKKAPRLQHNRKYRHHLRRFGLGAGVQSERDGLAVRASVYRRSLPCVQSFSLQESSVLRRGRRARRHRRARHRTPRRAHPFHAAHGLRLPRRLRGDFRAAAAKWLRVRMARFPSDSAQSVAAAMEF